jgi:DNA-binding transcriptional MerR regulator
VKIGELAAAAAVAPSLVRYYESRGVIPPARRRGGVRHYDSDALDRLRRALIARRLGLSLDETKAALERARPLTEIAAGRVHALDAEIRRLRVVRALLRHAQRSGALSPERYARVLARVNA